MLAAWVDGARADTLPLSDRAVHYGDAAFTTIRVHAGAACWLDAHVERLQLACTRLHLPMPDWTVLTDEIVQAACLEHAGVIKVLLSRGDGPRGYAPQGARGRRLVMVYAASAIDIAHYRDGIKVRFAELQLSDQPALAGLKHANRLEQILARAESDDVAIDEVLLCDQRDCVISATAANVFVRFGNQLRAPLLDRAGVSGVCRQQILQSPLPEFSVTVTAVHRDDILLADELFLSNAVRGIVPVRALGDHRPASNMAARALMQLLHPALGLPIPA